MKKRITPSLLALLCFFFTYGQVEVTNYGDIPENRLAISRGEHGQWDNSGNWKTIDVTK